MSQPGAASEIPMPAPWAAAAAVLALIAFGVFVGSVVSPTSQGEAAPTLLAAAPQATPAQPPAATPQPTPPPSTSAEATPEAASETTSETTPETMTKAANGPVHKAKGSQPAAGGGSTTAPGGGGTTPATTLPPIKHVFLIVLSDQGFSAAFGASSQAPYLSRTLRRQGELLENYYAVSAGELANGIALISGQGPNPQTMADCPLYSDLAPGTSGAEGQVAGSGCVFPGQTLTLADQLARTGKTWKAYLEDMGDDGAGQPVTCRHPVPGADDAAHAPIPGDPYVTWRNPFAYFHSLIDGPACTADDVGLDRLAPDLASPSATPSFAYIAPDRCDDGSPEPCAPGQASGLPAADAFLRKVVPEIESSSAYRGGGLIAITFDQAPQSGPGADASGCCVDGPFPNMTPTPGSSGSAAGPDLAAGSAQPAPAETSGGGKVGLLLISKYVKPNSLNAIGDYNHFSLLRSIENLFGLEPLGYAGAPGLLAFDKSVFNAGGRV